MTNSPASHPEGSTADANGLESKLKHLEFLQTVIARMSNSSFLFKGWAITIAVGLSAFAATNTKDALKVALIGAVVSSVLFWGLDGYYLWLERGFVDLYKKVAMQQPADIDFSMQTARDKAMLKWLRTCFRPHLIGLYGAMVVGEIIGLFLIKGT